MAKIWFCRRCGYEVPARGRCHSCGGRLERSPIDELPRLGDDEEVGYDLDGWDGEARGQLIVGLIEAGIEHRFEDEELVVAVDDEARTDDLVGAMTVGVPGDDPDAAAGPSGSEEAPPSGELAETLREDVELLAAAARRLRSDPTDMQADADIAQASAAVFAADELFAGDPDTWAAVGRVTRRLLAALGADEALEDEIRKQAAILATLVEPLLAGGLVTSPPVATAERSPGSEGAGLAGAGGEPAPSEEPESPAVSAGEAAEAVYQLPDWLPEQRAQLSLLLGTQHVPHRWRGGDLVVAESQVGRAEALFDRVDGVEGPEDDEARYRSLEELFAAADRFVGDPASASKAAAVLSAVEEADGPTPLGLDDAQWWAIRTRARTLADALEHGGNPEVAFAEATTLRDLLRALV
jgi:hypothetical protein